MLGDERVEVRGDDDEPLQPRPRAARGRSDEQLDERPAVQEREPAGEVAEQPRHPGGDHQRSTQVALLPVAPQRHAEGHERRRDREIAGQGSNPDRVGRARGKRSDRERAYQRGCRGSDARRTPMHRDGEGVRHDRDRLSRGATAPQSTRSAPRSACA